MLWSTLFRSLMPPDIFSENIKVEVHYLLSLLNKVHPSIKWAHWSFSKMMLKWISFDKIQIFIWKAPFLKVVWYRYTKIIPRRNLTRCVWKYMKEQRRRIYLCRKKHHILVKTTTKKKRKSQINLINESWLLLM